MFFPVVVHALSVRGKGLAPCFAQAAAGLILLAGLAASPTPAGAEPSLPAPGAANLSRQDRPPRKVLVGTVISGYGFLSQPLEKRLQWLDDSVEKIATQAKTNYPDKRLDLVVLPEFLVSRPGDSLAQQAVRLEEVQPRLAACASRHGCYLVVPSLLQEANPSPRYSNAALLVDRSGQIKGIYRKVHPVAPQGSDALEGGTTPGPDFPVFDCDFGRLGIQICFDMLYADGWQALAKQGTEIVAMPSASPETVRPIGYALQHQYYIVSAAPRDHAAVFSPLGLIEAQVSEEGAVLVHQIDLSYSILHWEAALEEGAALSRKYGNKVGFHYYPPEDMGIFWSNDPKTTIGQMIGSLGLTDSDTNIERVRRLQDKARGGPPIIP